MCANITVWMLNSDLLTSKFECFSFSGKVKRVHGGFAPTLGRYLMLLYSFKGTSERARSCLLQDNEGTSHTYFLQIH